MSRPHAAFARLHRQCEHAIRNAWKSSLCFDGRKHEGPFCPEGALLGKPDSATGSGRALAHGLAHLFTSGILPPLGVGEEHAERVAIAVTGVTVVGGLCAALDRAKDSPGLLRAPGSR